MKAMLKIVVTSALLLGTALNAAAQGVVPPCAGAVCRGFGGTAIGVATDDSIGSFYWNPAVIGALQPRVDLSMEILFTNAHVSSSVGANVVAPGVPATNISGSSGTNSGVMVGPSFGFVLRRPDSKTTFGLSLVPRVVTSANYRQNSANPVFQPPPPLGIGLGGYYLNLTVLETSAAIVRSFGKMHVGGALDVDAINFQLNPGVIAPAQSLTGPNDTLFVRWPTLTNSRQRWGVGGHFGVFYEGHGNWHFGAMARTPVYFNRLKWDSTDILGQYQQVSIPYSLPAYVGVGVSYTGIKQWTFAADYKYAFYDTAEFLGDAARFNADGSANGLGYKNSSVFNIGIQYDGPHKLHFRTGVKINTEVLDARNTTFNLAAGILKYSPSVGLSRDIDEKTVAHISYVHGFAPDLGPAPILSPITNAPIPGTSVKSQLAENNIIFGISRRF